MRYFRSGSDLMMMSAPLGPIPIPLASLPVAAFVLLGIWCQSPVTVAAAIVLGIGHIDEGEIYGTHWIVLHSVDRAPDGSIAGFGIVDSASSMTYLTAQELADIYYGHDGTTITDLSRIQIFSRAR